MPRASPALLQRDGGVHCPCRKATGWTMGANRGDNNMRVLAARFPDRRRASTVLGALHRRFPVDPQDVAIAPLGVPGEASDGEIVLAGRFPEEVTDQVGALVNQAGGEIVVDVDEAWTRPPAGLGAHAGSQIESHRRPH